MADDPAVVLLGRPILEGPERELADQRPARGPVDLDRRALEGGPVGFELGRRAVERLERANRQTVDPVDGVQLFSQPGPLMIMATVSIGP